VAPLLKLDWRWGFVATALAPVRGGGEFAVLQLLRMVVPNTVGEILTSKQQQLFIRKKSILRIFTLKLCFDSSGEEYFSSLQQKRLNYHHLSILFFCALNSVLFLLTTQDTSGLTERFLTPSPEKKNNSAI
jgi:hypothetical protein